MDPASAAVVTWADLWRNVPGVAFGLMMTWLYLQERAYRNEREKEDRAEARTERKEQSAADLALAQALNALRDVIMGRAGK